MRPRSLMGTRDITVVMSSGIMMAVPTAWMMRPASSTSKPGARAATRVPVVNAPIAVANTARRSSRCRNQPVVGMTIAMVSMKPVDSHCAAWAVTSSEAISCGMALTMIVSLRITTKVATVRRRRIGTWSTCRSSSRSTVGTWSVVTEEGMPGDSRGSRRGGEPAKTSGRPAVRPPRSA